MQVTVEIPDNIAHQLEETSDFCLDFFLAKG